MTHLELSGYMADNEEGYDGYKPREREHGPWRNGYPEDSAYQRDYHRDGMIERSPQSHRRDHIIFVMNNTGQICGSGHRKAEQKFIHDKE